MDVLREFRHGELDHLYRARVNAERLEKERSQAMERALAALDAKDRELAAKDRELDAKDRELKTMSRERARQAEAAREAEEALLAKVRELEELLARTKS